jgi:glycosyltransferase involved in cell wall biosynthesis
MLASTYPRWANDPEPAFVHELAKRLTATFAVHVLCPHAKGAARRGHLEGVEVHRYQYAPESWETLVSGGGMLANLKSAPLRWLLVPGFLLVQFLATLRLLRAIQPAVVHAHWLLPQGLLAALAITCSRRHCALLVTSHGIDLFALRGALPTYLKRRVIKSADAITVVSSAMVPEVMALGASGKDVVVSPMGVDFSGRFKNSDIVRLPNHLLFVGRLVEKKGLEHLLRAMPQILVRCPDIQLEVVGEGPLRPALQQLALGLGLESRVTFRGALPNVELPKIYARATMLIAPFVVAKSGDQEGLGLVVAEALACGCPVIVGDVPATRDFCIPLIEPVTPASIAVAVFEMLKHPEAERRQFAEAHFRAVAGRLDWEVVAARYRDLLQDLLQS